MYIDPKTIRTFNYATPISCYNNPQNVMPFDPDNDEHFVLTPKPVIRDTLMLFEPNQVQTAMSPNSFTAQEFGMLN